MLHVVLPASLTDIEAFIDPTTGTLICILLRSVCCYHPFTTMNISDMQHLLQWQNDEVVRDYMCLYCWLAQLERLMWSRSRCYRLNLGSFCLFWILYIWTVSEWTFNSGIFCSHHSPSVLRWGLVALITALVKKDSLRMFRHSPGWMMQTINIFLLCVFDFQELREDSFISK